MPSPSATISLAIGLVVAACGGKVVVDKQADVRTDSAPSAALVVAAQKVDEITGFKAPESARYDEALDVWFVSNVNGAPSDQDGNGFISRISGDRNTVDTAFVKGGEGGVTLNAPKGLAISGDTLWAADIDAVRGFDVRTGAPLATIDLKPLGAVFLNDIVVGPDGALYVTDTGIHMTARATTHPGPDRVFRVANDSITVVLTFAGAEGPNGIAYDAERGWFIVVPYTGRSMFRWMPGAETFDTVATGPGGYDGAEVLADGRLLVTSWTDSTVHVLDGDVLSPFIRGVPGPADIGIDTTRGLVAIPLFESGRVEFWTIPAR